MGKVKFFCSVFGFFMFVFVVIFYENLYGWMVFLLGKIFEVLVIREKVDELFCFKKVLISYFCNFKR